MYNRVKRKSARATKTSRIQIFELFTESRPLAEEGCLLERHLFKAQSGILTTESSGGCLVKMKQILETLPRATE